MRLSVTPLTPKLMHVPHTSAQIRILQLLSLILPFFTSVSKYWLAMLLQSTQDLVMLGVHVLLHPSDAHRL